jgi:hypothetical protein
VAFQPKEKRPRPGVHRHRALIPTNRGVETISVAPAASEHDHIVSSRPSTDVVDFSYRWRPPKTRQGR